MHMKMTIEDALAHGLNNLPEPTELTDADGNILGTFTPSSEQRKRIYDWLNSLVSDEELERAAQQTGGCSTSELLEKLSRL